MYWVPTLLKLTEPKIVTSSLLSWIVLESTSLNGQKLLRSRKPNLSQTASGELQEHFLPIFSLIPLLGILFYYALHMSSLELP
jgi:hypothetical protein